MAGEAHVFQPAFGQFILLSLRDLRRFAFYKLNPARGTAAVAAARMQLVDTGFIDKGQYQSFTGRYLERPVVFNS